MDDFLTLRAGRSDVPGLLRRRQRAAGPARSRRDGRGDPRRLRRRRSRELRAVLRLGHPALQRSRCRTSSTATSTARSTSRAARARDRAACASVPSASSPRSSSASSPTIACGASSASSRCTPGLAPYQALALYAVITYMDTVNGVYVPDGGMHALPAALAAAAEKAGVEFRYDTPVERDPARATARAARSGRPARRRRGARADRRRLQRRPAGRVPNAAPRARRRRASPGAAGTRRRRVVWHAGVARRAARRVSPTTTSTSVATGTRRSARCSTTGTRMPDPSMLVTVPTIDEPAHGPARPPRAVRARAGPEPRRPASTGRIERDTRPR